MAERTLDRSSAEGTSTVARSVAAISIAVAPSGRLSTMLLAFALAWSSLVGPPTRSTDPMLADMSTIITAFWPSASLEGTQGRANASISRQSTSSCSNNNGEICRRCHSELASRSRIRERHRTRLPTPVTGRLNLRRYSAIITPSRGRATSAIGASRPTVAFLALFGRLFDN